MPVLAYDTETTSLSRFDGEVFSFSLCDQNENTEVHRLDVAKERPRSLRRLKEIMDGKTTLVMHNAKFDIGYTERLLNRSLEHVPFHDTAIMSHLLQNHHYSHRLKDICWDLAGYPKDGETEVKKYTRGGKTYANVPREIMERYQIGDVERTMLLYLFFWPKIQKRKALMDIYKNEIELVYTTLRMENRGFMLHRKKCQKLIEKVQRDLAPVREKLDEMAGKEINPDSTKDVRFLLYEKYRMPVLSKTKTGLPSTAKDVLKTLLEDHENEAIAFLQKFRSWRRGVSILTSYLELADKRGIIHPDINTSGVSEGGGGRSAPKTGRESCARPNLQNVEKSGGLLNPFSVPSRTVFRPRPGFVHFHIDYSGIEMRLLIHYSGEPQLTKIANTKDGDVHLPATRIFFGKLYDPNDKNTKKYRDAAKNANFARPYGGQLAKLAATLGMPVREAKHKIDRYDNTFPRLAFLGRRIGEIVERQGYIETNFGRRLYLPPKDAHAGLNYLIQGTAADIMKRGQVRVDHYLRKVTGDKVRILLPIHDEIIVECPRSWLCRIRPILRKVRLLMIDFPDRFNVPLEVECEIASLDWSRKEKYEL